MGPDLLRFAVLPASERWEMGETTSHPLVYDATPASILPIVLIVVVSLSILGHTLGFTPGVHPGVASWPSLTSVSPERCVFDQQRQKTR
jgi:hypothetical protein